MAGLSILHLWYLRLTFFSFYKGPKSDERMRKKQFKEKESKVPFKFRKKLQKMMAEKIMHAGNLLSSPLSSLLYNGLSLTLC